MTVIAWDGKTLAVDKQCTFGEIIVRSTKFEILSNGEVMVRSGATDYSLKVFEWYRKGANPKDYPSFQQGDGWVRLVVASKKGVVEFDQTPIPLPCEDPFMAWGAGSFLALGAMAMGATAKQAVMVACQHCVSCGVGVDTIDLATGQVETILFKPIWNVQSGMATDINLLYANKLPPDKFDCVPSAYATNPNGLL
jgi:hypothetical protein